MTYDSRDMNWLSAIDLATRIASGDISPREAVAAALAQIDRHDASLNAVVTRCYAEAQEQAARAEEAVRQGKRLGPLHGVPLLVKDLHYTSGLRTTMGSRLYEDFVPTFDHPIVARLKAAGAIVVGKTNTSEFGLIPLTASGLLGDACNPWNIDHNTGGSSGGSAAAVASGMVPIATGSDGGGSIRVPASFCGVFGIKPQHGRVPHIHQPPGWESLAHHGPIARQVRDAARMLDVTAGPHALDRWSLPPAGISFEAACDAPVGQLKLAWSADLGGRLIEPEIRDVCQRAAQQFAELGCHVEEIDLDLPDLTAEQQTIVLCEAAAAFADRRDEWQQVITPSLTKMLPKADTFTMRDLLAAHWSRESYWEQIAPIFEEYDALLTPVAGIAAPLNGTLGPREIAGQKIRALAWLGFCVPFNMTWQPAASLPVGRTGAGLPVGLQVVGRRHDEATVLRLCAAYEDAYGTLGPPPVVSELDEDRAP